MNNVIFHFYNTIKIQDLGTHCINHAYTHPNRKLGWDVFLYVAEGEMQVWEDEQEYVIRKGQFLFLKNGVQHWGEPKTKAGTSWYWIHFLSDSHSEVDQELNINLSSTPLPAISHHEYNKYIELPKHGDIPYAKKMENQLDSLILLFQSTDPLRVISLSIKTMELFLELFKESSTKQTITKSDRTVQKIITYLEQKESYALDSKDLSSTLGMNYSYLCEVFKRKTGHTIHVFNAQIFMNKAVKMLQSSPMNISEISDQIGFKNPFYFSRVFRKIHGYAPSEYLSKT